MQGLETSSLSLSRGSIAVGVRSLVRVGSSSGGKREEEAWVTSGLWFLPPFWAPLTPEVLVLDFLEVDIIFVVDVFDVDFVLAFLILDLDFVVFFVLTDFSCSSDEDEELDILLVLVPLDFVVVVVILSCCWRCYFRQYCFRYGSWCCLCWTSSVCFDCSLWGRWCVRVGNGRRAVFGRVRKRWRWSAVWRFAVAFVLVVVVVDAVVAVVVVVIASAVVVRAASAVAVVV
mmetsp:Transcript_13190/g.26726  ORF Transcript_13190/g.26726 Transcript_13190/m.26726 type:complete len:230 (+) Transcript_13190:232-921(+)